MNSTAVFGVGDASFRAAGGVEGIDALVSDFYRIMDTRADAAQIRSLHPQDLASSADKLARFLCGWLGGPKRYAEKYGPINIPQFHAHWPIGEAERDAWLACMRGAIALQPYSPEFSVYLLQQLSVPAERVYRVSQEHRARGR